MRTTLSTIFLLLLMLVPNEESPKDRHARLVREAAEACEAWQVIDPAQSTYLSTQFYAVSPWWRWLSDISPFVIAVFLVAGISLLTLGSLFWLVARPLWPAKRA